MNQEQKDLAFGSLLGDSSLSPNVNYTTFRLRVSHKAKDKPYLFDKYEILKDVTTSPPHYELLPPDKRTRKRYARWTFNTIQISAFRFYWGMFYQRVKNPDGTFSFQKGVPTKEQLKANLTPAALAWLFMDDGSVKDRSQTIAMRISVDSFSLEEQNRLCNVINETYGLNLYPQIKKKNPDVYNIYIPSGSAVQFVQIIKPHFLKHMISKIPDGLLHLVS